MLRWTMYVTVGVFLLSLLNSGTSAAPSPQTDIATVSFTAVTCPAALPLDQVSDATCTESRPDVIIDYDKTLIEVEHITVTTDQNGKAEITVPDPANGARFDIALPGNLLYYAERPGPQPGYGVYLADCGDTGDAAGFYYTGLGIAFDELAAGDDIDCRLSFVPPVASTVALFFGTCQDPGEFMQTLTPMTLPYGEFAGAEVAAPAEASLTTLGASLDELLAEDHLLAVYDEDDLQVSLACGNIGGLLNDDGSIAIALAPQNGSLYSGIATLTPDGDRVVQINAYLAPDLDGSDRDVAGITGSLTADGGSPAGIYAGTCDGSASSDAAAVLDPVTAPGGAEVGADFPGPVETSVTTIDLSLDELVASDYAIAVFDEDAPDIALACGEIGGIRGDDRTMVIGLPALGDSLYSGVAVITTTDAGTSDIAIYVAPDLDGSNG